MRPRYRQHSSVISSQHFAPSVRMVIVLAWADDGPGEAGHEIHPVVAIRASIVDVYDDPKPTDGSRLRTSPSHRDMIRYGWRYEDRQEETKYLVNDEGTLMDADIAFDGVNIAWEAVACTWPPSRDEKRLEAIIAGVKEKAMVKAKASARKAAR